MWIVISLVRSNISFYHLFRKDIEHWLLVFSHRVYLNNLDWLRPIPLDATPAFEYSNYSRVFI